MANWLPAELKENDVKRKLAAALAALVGPYPAVKPGRDIKSVYFTRTL